MSDNVAITAGSGTTVSTEEITMLNGGAVAAQHVQRVGAAFRTADGAAYDAATGAGNVSAGTQRVTHADDDPVVTALTAAAAAKSLPSHELDATTDLTRVFDDGSTAAEESLVTATASQTTRVHRIIATAAGACNIEFRDGSAGSVLRKLVFPAAGAYVLEFDPRPYITTSTNTALYWYRSAAVACSVEVDYVKSA